MALFHFTVAVRGRLAIAKDERQRRLIVRALARVGGLRLVLFCLVDDHLHTVLSDPKVGYLGRSIRRVIRSLRSDLRLKPGYLDPVQSRGHLLNLLHYFLEQPQKHGLREHPALWSGSCFQDLVGVRLLPGFDPGVLGRELPRLRLREVFGKLGLDQRRLDPVNDEELRRVGAARLIELAASVHCVGPDLEGNSDPVVAARALAIAAAAKVELPTREMAHYLDVGLHAVRRLARKEVAPVELRSLRLLLALETRATSGGERPRANALDT